MKSVSEFFHGKRGIFIPTMRQEEAGRSLVELILMLGIMGILSIGAIQLYRSTVTDVKTQNTAKLISTMALERQGFAMKSKAEGRRYVQGPHGNLYIENGTAGNRSRYFWIVASALDLDFCQQLKESKLINADMIEVNDVLDGACTQNSKIAFYFRKNPDRNDRLTWQDEEGNVHLCPVGASGCSEQGEATACDTGYYLSEGTCELCGQHVATCEDENTPTTCQPGYELHWGSCIVPPKVCTSDLQCDVCATCDTVTHRCQGECNVPVDRCHSNLDCGGNACVICDVSTHSCRYSCGKLEYLQSSGTQYIDTGYYPNENTKVEINVSGISADSFAASSSGTWFLGSRQAYQDKMFGSYYNPSNTRLHFAFGSIMNYSSYTTSNMYGNNKVFVMDKNGLYINGTKVVNNTDTNSFTSPATLALFGLNNNGSFLSQTAEKIYYCKIWDDDVLVRDFVPVHAPFQPVGKQNCMLDRVSGGLFCNTGTGDDFATN